MTKEKMCTLYKYMRYSNHLLEALKNQRLYMSSCEQLNDPFDLYIIDGNIDKKVDDLRILCLTNSFIKNKMWSYYADSHKGVCLTVELPARYIYSVCYTTDRIDINTDLNKIFSEMKNKPKKNLVKPYDMDDKLKIGYIKNSQFSDEIEYRCVTSSNYSDEYIIDDENEKFFKVKIKKIYLGVDFDMNSGAYSKIIEQCITNKIKLAKMQKSKKHYSLEVSDIDLK